MEGLDHAVGGGEGEDIDAALARRLDAILDAGSEAEPRAAHSGIETSSTSVGEWPAFGSFAHPGADPSASSFSFSDLGAKGAHETPGHGAATGKAAQAWSTTAGGAAPGLAREGAHPVRWRGIAPLSGQDPFSAWGAKGSTLSASSTPVSGAGTGAGTPGADGGAEGAFGGNVAAEALAAWHAAPAAVTTAPIQSLDRAPVPTHAPGAAVHHHPASTTLSASANTFVRGQAPQAGGQPQGRGGLHAQMAHPAHQHPHQHQQTVLPPRFHPQQHPPMPQQQHPFMGAKFMPVQPGADASGMLHPHGQQQHPQYQHQLRQQAQQAPQHPQQQGGGYVPAAAPYGMAPLSGPPGASFQMHRTTSAPVPGYAAVYPRVGMGHPPGAYAAMPPAAMYGPAFAGHVRPPGHGLMPYWQQGEPMGGMVARPIPPTQHPYQQYAAPRPPAAGPAASVANTAGAPGTAAAVTVAAASGAPPRAPGPAQPPVAPAGAAPVAAAARAEPPQPPRGSLGAATAAAPTKAIPGAGREPAPRASAPSDDAAGAHAASSNGKASKAPRSRNTSAESASAARAPAPPPRGRARSSASAGGSGGGSGVIAAATDTYPWPVEMVDPPSPSSERVYCEVQFKGSRRAMFVHEARPADGAPLALAADHLVKVDADRGVDLGRVVRVLGEKEFAEEAGAAAGGGEDTKPRCKRLLRRATLEETRQLARKAEMEEEALEFCRNKVAERELPMHVIDAEYQFDNRKLTFFFDAEKRIDFRELVRDLFAMYRTRIWLQQLSHGGRR